MDAPIGIFDSGLGGLTVARAVAAALPRERLVYLGDTARVPYGTRSAHTIIRYARSCAAQLQARGVKVLVVACNTVSAVALDMLRLEMDVPVLGVVLPGARAGVLAARNKRLGVIATDGTIRSGAYVRAVASLSSRVEVIGRPAPLLVPLAEEGWVQGEVPRLVVHEYLAPLAEARVGALVLGCTHYPVLSEVIRERVEALCGPDVPVVDSAEATTAELEALLHDRGLATTASQGGLDLLVTDRPDRFVEVASRFLGRPLEAADVEQVDL